MRGRIRGMSGSLPSKHASWHRAPQMLFAIVYDSRIKELLPQKDASKRTLCLYWAKNWIINKESPEHNACFYRVTPRLTHIRMRARRGQKRGLFGVWFSALLSSDRKGVLWCECSVVCLPRVLLGSVHIDYSTA